MLPEMARLGMKPTSVYKSSPNLQDSINQMPSAVLQFRRDGPNGNHLLNPGSVGMPLDGDIRAAWAARNDGEFEFRRTEYDIERAAAGWRKLGGDFGSFAAQRIERGRD